MQKLSWILNVVLLMVIAGLLYVFLVLGSVKETTDGRTAIIITNAERLKILGDMRKFLEHVQTMVEAIGDDDMVTFSTAASGVGLKQKSSYPATLTAKLPLEFKSFEAETYKSFDYLAKLADDGAGTKAVASELSLIMSNCTYCHETYRLEVDDE